jgi:hypothetical protein
VNRRDRGHRAGDRRRTLDATVVTLVVGVEEVVALGLTADDVDVVLSDEQAPTATTATNRALNQLSTGDHEANRLIRRLSFDPAVRTTSAA